MLIFILALTPFPKSITILAFICPVQVCLSIRVFCFVLFFKDRVPFLLIHRTQISNLSVFFLSYFSLDVTSKCKEVHRLRIEQAHKMFPDPAGKGRRGPVARSGFCTLPGQRCDSSIIRTHSSHKSKILAQSFVSRAQATFVILFLKM